MRINTKILILLLISLLHVATTFADRYKVLKVYPRSIITISGKKAVAGKTVFQDTETIVWGSKDDAMDVANLSNGKKFYLSKRQFESCGNIKSISKFLLRTSETSTRDVTASVREPIIQHSQNNSIPQKRIALVIGNGAYKSFSSLLNPGRDAASITSKLMQLGFDVIECYDYSKPEMLHAIDYFTSMAKVYNVAMVYYAGHGVQQNGHNYLIPINAPSINADELVECDFLVNSLAASNVPIQMVFLDACRSLTQVSTQRGMGYMESSKSLLVFSTSFGQVAYDSDESGATNSPFATALLESLDKPGLNIANLMQQVKARTEQLTQNRQHPTMSGIPADFVFRPQVQTTQSVPAQRSTTTVAPSTSTTPSTTQPSSAITSITANKLNPADIEIMISSGKKAMTAMRYGTAYSNFKKAADQGSLEGYLYLGILFKNENYEHYNLDMSEKYLTVAAQGGNHEAQYQLGLLYIGHNKTLARKWLYEAAKSGHAEAIRQYNKLK